MESAAKKEERIIYNSGIDIQLGGQFFEIKKLGLRKSKKWRAKAVELDRKRLEQIDAVGKDIEDKERLESLRNNEVLFNANPEFVAELVVSFCEGQGNGVLTREWLEENVTDEEAGAAFGKIMDSLLPLEMMLGGKPSMNRKIVAAVQKAQIETSSSPSAAP